MTATVAERVAAGVAWLGGNDPLWADFVEQRRPRGWLFERHVAVGNLTAADAVRLGLTPDPDAVFVAELGALDNEWRRVIGERRAGGAS